MPFQPTVQSTTRLATTSVQSANFGNAVFASAHSYFTQRLRGYISVDELNADSSIPKTSNAYKALVNAFSSPGAAVPIYLARREVDDITLTPSPVLDSQQYSVVLKVIDTTDGSEVREDTITVTSGVSATAETIATQIFDAISLLAIDSADYVVTDAVGSVNIIPSADRAVLLSEQENLVDTYTSTETASDMFAAIQAEDNENWYFMTSEVREPTFVLELAQAVEATETSDYRKQYRVAYSGADTLLPETDPNTDLLGKLKDAELTRTHGEWHDKADEVFPELAACVYQGGFFPGTQSWKFMTGLKTPAARDPSTQGLLTTSQQGYISDRNASWVSKERGTSFMHGGTTAKGTDVWIDVQRAKDWIDDTIEVRILNLLLNRAAAGRPLTFKSGHVALVKGVITGVLTEAVDRDILMGFEEVQVPDNFTFEAQAKRELRDVTWTGYLAGKIHFAVIDGVLTYQTESTEA